MKNFSVITVKFVNKKLKSANNYWAYEINCVSLGNSEQKLMFLLGYANKGKQ